MGLHGRLAPQKIVFYFDRARNMEKSFWIRPFKVPVLSAGVMCFSSLNDTLATQGSNPGKNLRAFCRPLRREGDG